MHFLRYLLSALAPALTSGVLLSSPQACGNRYSANGSRLLVGFELAGDILVQGDIETSFGEVL
jgi:hypothetical protein